MLCSLEFFKSSTSAVALCMSTCSLEASKVFSAVMVVDTASVPVLTVSLGSSGNLLLHRLLW